MPVQIFSCETGQGPDPFARELAIELRSPVTAPAQILWIYADGKTVPVSVKRDENGRITRMDTSKKGY